ncbi:MAG TPA: BlaI/MecI/CopY family transcriptional regulator [Polyangia bacterium]|nr:BlaI/MecI/CopY family transcriptional regulator [Polyangia bacterium]
MSQEEPGPIPGGKLEYAVLAAVWELGSASAREIYDRVGVPLGLVYTTTSRVLDRLQAKGLVSRDKTGKGFVYQARVARREVDRARLSHALSHVLGEQPRPALASLVDAIEAIDPGLVDELARAVEARRRSR